MNNVEQVNEKAFGVMGAGYLMGLLFF